MKKILNYIIYFSIIISVIGVVNVKASTIDDLPDFTSLPGYTNYYVIYDHDFDRENSSVYNSENRYTIAFFDRPIAYLSVTNNYIRDWNPYGFTRVNSIPSGVSSSPYRCTYYEWYYNKSDSWELGYSRGYSTNNPSPSMSMFYTTIDLFDINNNTLYYQAGYSRVQDLSKIVFRVNYELVGNDKWANVTIDFREFEENENYRYYFGEDLALMEDITDSTNGFYFFNTKYRTTIYAMVKDENGNIVDSNVLDLNDTELSRNQYKLTFHMYDGSSFVKIVNSDTNYNNFFTEQENRKLYSGSRIALGFYTDEELTNEFVFDGTMEPAMDLDIYINWTSELPIFTPKIKYEDSKIKLYFEFNNWSDSNYFIAYENPRIPQTYTFNNSNSQNETYFYVERDDVISMRYLVHTENGMKTLTTRYVNINDLIDLEENIEIKETLDIEQGNFNVINDIFNNIKKAFDEVREIFSYFWSKCNKKIKQTIIYVLSLSLIVSIFKMIIGKRG